MKGNHTKYNLSVEKTMKLVEIMANHNEPMRLQNISQEAEIPASTTLRMLGTLLQLGYVTQDPDTSKYDLSLKFAYIGEQVKRRFNITQISYSYILDLSNKTGECCCLAVQEGKRILYLDVVTNQVNNILTTTQRIGKSAPMYCTGIGKLLLTNYSNEELKGYVNSTELSQFTPNTITKFDDLVSELDTISKRGYAIDNEECDQGANCVAAPIYDYSGHIVAGISVTAPSIRLTSERIDEIIPMIKDTAGIISRALGYNK